MHFGSTLRLLRVDAGLSLRQLAQTIGVSSAYLSRVENGHDPPPTPDRLVAIARKLALPPSALLELANRLPSVVAAYLESVPAANELFLEIAQRNLSTAQIARVKTFIEQELLASPPARRAKSPRLGDLLQPERVILRLSCAALEDAVDLAASAAADGDFQRARRIAAAVASHEEQAPTAVGGGLAIPHAHVRGATSAAAVVTLSPPLAAATPDGEPLKVLVLLVLDEDGHEDLELLARVARLAVPGAIDDVWSAPDAASVVRVIEMLGL